MKIPKIKRNKKLEMLIVTLLVVIIGIAAIFTLFTAPKETNTQGNQQTSTQENGAKGEDPQNTSKNEETSSPESTPTPTPTTTVDFSTVSFPLASNSIKNIEITSATNGICNEQNKWELKFFINNKTANKQKKYAYQINPLQGTVDVRYDKGVSQSDFDNALNFYYTEEFGNMSPLLNEGITWMPPKEAIQNTKLFVQVMDINSKNIETVFYILIGKDNDSYRIAGIESCELSGSEKEKAYNIALNYYASKQEGIKTKGIEESVVAIIPQTENNIYYVNNVAKNSTGMGPIVAVYINYYNGDNSQLPQGCFIAYLKKDTLAVIGEGKMLFADSN